MFDPDSEIDDMLWDTIGAASGDEAAFLDALNQMGKEGVLRVFQAYVLARTELVDRLVATERAPGASEDTMDDLADSMVCQGRLVYLDVFRGDADLPHRDRWHQLPGLIHVLGDVFYDRFDEDIYDHLED